MKLWVDDVRPAPDGYIWVKSVNMAKEYIEFYQKEMVKRVLEHPVIEEADKWVIEVIDIDYDSGDYIRILDWLEENGFNYPIHIHFINPIDRQNIETICRKNGGDCMSLYRFDTEIEKNTAKERLVRDIAYLTLVKNNPQIFTEPEQYEVSYVGTGLNPCKINDLLKELGYTRGDINENGWEGEFWITYTKKYCCPLTLYYEAWDFDIKLRIEED